MYDKRKYGIWQKTCKGHMTMPIMWGHLAYMTYNILLVWKHVCICVMWMFARQVCVTQSQRKPREVVTGHLSCSQQIARSLFWWQKASDQLIQNMNIWWGWHTLLTLGADMTWNNRRPWNQHSMSVRKKIMAKVLDLSWTSIPKFLTVCLCPALN